MNWWFRSGGVLRVRCALLLQLLEERAVVVEGLLGSGFPAQGGGLEVTVGGRSPATARVGDG